MGRRAGRRYLSEGSTECPGTRETSSFTVVLNESVKAQALDIALFLSFRHVGLCSWLTLSLTLSFCFVYLFLFAVGYLCARARLCVCVRSMHMCVWRVWAYVCGHTRVYVCE